jgi:hypothetical protein
MVVHHCATALPGELDSGLITANVAAMIQCAECGYLDITGQADGHIFAIVLPEGWAPSSGTHRCRARRSR